MLRDNPTGTRLTSGLGVIVVRSLRPASLRSVLVTIYALVLALTVAQPALAQQGQAVPVEGGLSARLAVPGMQWLIGGEQLVADERSALVDPRAVAARAASRTAYEGLSASAAARLAASAAPAAVAAPSALPRLQAGQRITRYLSDHAAQVYLGGGKRAVIVSSGPIAVPTSTGGHRALDLALLARGGGYAPAASPAPTLLPMRVSSGIKLADSGLSLTPVDAGGTPLRGGGRVVGDAVLYANTQRDADTLAKPTPTGFETYTLLRSVESPKDLYYRVGVPAGAVLAMEGSTLLVRDGRHAIATIPTPSAIDAEGTQVPVSTSLSGHLLSLRIAHVGSQVRYPVSVDPEVVDNKIITVISSEHYNWAFTTTNSTAFRTISEYPWAEIYYGSGTYASPQYGSYVYGTQGESRIFKLTTTTKQEDPAAIRSAISIANPAGTKEAEASLAATGESVTTICAVSECKVGTVTSANKESKAYYEVKAVSSGSTNFSNTLTAASVYILQEKGPSAHMDTADATVEGATNPLYGNTWANSKSWVGVDAFDPGVGVSKEILKSASAPTWKITYESGWPNYCAGAQCNECHEITCPNASKATPAGFQLGTGLPEGEDTVEAEVEDSVALKATATAVKIKYDNAAPHNLELLGLPSSHEIGEQSYHLKAKASDGSGTTLSAGIASIALDVDGVEVGAASGWCSPGPCPASSKEWTINGSEFATGQHTFTVVATDAAGNVATESVTVTVHHGSPISVGPASVDPITGEATVGATDVSIAGPKSALTVSRSYNSKQLTAGANGPLGPQWTMSLGGQSSLTENLEHNMVLVAANGSQTVFTSIGGGKFKAPAGDANLVLTEKYISGKRAFVLSNPSTTASTTYQLPGTSGVVWKPTIQAGATASETVTFAYQVVEVGGVNVIQPTEALAPVPSGVTCALLKQGCQALTFKYATTTTATSENPSGWGDYAGRLTQVYFTAWDPVAKKMVTPTVAQYSYDSKGNMRAEWDPRISPALKTLYGYDSEGHLTSIAPAGQQPQLLAYGLNAGDLATGRLVSVSRPGAATALGEGIAPANTAAPSLSTTSVTIGKSVSVSSNGTWSNTPLAYSYQWQRCGSGGVNCVPIYGARNQSYTPVIADAGYALVAQVTAVNAGGSVTTSTSASSVISNVAPSFAFQFGSLGSGNGQFRQPTGAAFDSSGDIWVADFTNNRVQKFSAAGAFIATYGTSGTGNGQFKNPFDIAIDKENNLFVTDNANCRVEELSSAGVFVRAFGTCGSGPGQFNNPSQLALDGEGNVWVADYGNNRVEEFTSSGTFMRAEGTAGTGNGQLKTPRGVACVGENVYVADTGNNRVEEFSASGTYVAQFGASGSENGQFSSPVAVAVEPLSGDLYVVDYNNNRVQQFTAAGTFVAKFGTVGTGSGQLKTPYGVAVSATGAIAVADYGNNRVSAWSPTPSPVYAAAFGSLGSGNGQLNKPIGDAVDPMGNVWVTDSSNNRIEKFSAYGVFLGAYGSFGTGHGQFDSPGGIAINQATGNVYVTDQKNGRVEEFSPSGEYLAEFGKPGVGNGEFSGPYGIAIDASGNIWVIDLSNARVQEFSQSGTIFTFVRAVGKEGTGNGEFIKPKFIAFSGGNAYVTDSGNARVQELSSTGTYMAQFGSKGTGNGQFEAPEGIAADPETGTLYVADTGKNRVEEFSTTGAFLGTFGSVGSGEGQFKSPVGLAFNTTGMLYVDDYGNNRIVKGTAGNVLTEPPAPPTVGTTAVTTIAYKVPVSGTGAPYSLGSSEVAAWSQEDLPTEATAVFPPDEQQTNPVSDYRRATVYYLDNLDRLVNVATPNGGISTSEYNTYNEVVRSLTPDNRVTALKEGSKSAEVSKLLDTQSTYGSEGTELTSTLGPQHTIKLASGSEKQARRHTVYSYDEGAPSEGGPYRLVTKVTEGAQITGEAEADVRTTATSYAGQNGLGWILRQPTSVTTDPSGLKLVHTTIYDPATGNVAETRTPGAGAASETTPSGFLSQWGSLGSGNGQFSKPSGSAVDSEGNVWVADTANNRVQEFSSAGTYVRQFSGTLTKPEGIAVDSENHVWVADTGKNLVQEYSSTGTLIAAYGGSGELAGHISAPDGIATLTTEFEHTVYVVNRTTNNVVVFNSEGTGFLDRTIGSTGTGNGQLKEPRQVALDGEGNLWVADAGNSRVEEFSPEGIYRSKFGTLGSGNGELSKPWGVAFDAEGHIWVSDTGNNRLQEFSSAGSYMRQMGSVGTGEAQMKEPGELSSDSTSHLYLADTGNNRVQRWISPALLHESSGTGGTHGSQTIYYSNGSNSSYPACGGHPEWTNKPCQTQPASQPNTTGVPNLPVVTYTYNLLGEAEKVTSTVGTDTRTTTNTYDTAGRVLTTAITSTVGTALPTVTNEYNSTTGMLVKQSTTVSEKTQSLTSVFNSLGELTSYTDADGNVSSYTYDVDGRAETLNDGKGTDTYSYDTTTGAENKLADSAAGTFTASYDANGNLISEGYPNAMSASYTYNSEGQVTALQYVKNAHCATSCPETWFSDSVIPSVHGQWLSRSGSLASQAYTYDNAGRLTQTQNTPAGKGCTTHIYAYDEETNRLSLTTRAPGVEGKCATEGGTVENHSYDPANRLTDSGISYDSFGATTKLSAADAGGSELTSSYYDDSQLASQTQNGQTIGYQLDPAGRMREVVSTGKVVATEINHYSGSGIEPAWTGELSAQWSRDITGIDGELVAIQHNGETPILQLINLHGDVIATASDSEMSTALASTVAEASEYGVPGTEAPAKYSWLGGHELPTGLPSGVTAMGMRSYVPQLGRFLQTDPVPGGSANAYAYTFGDPLRSYDLSGMYTMTISRADEEYLGSQAAAGAAAYAAEIRAAEEAAAAAEAERKAAEAAEQAGYLEGEEAEEWGEEGEEGEAEYVSFDESIGSSAPDGNDGKAPIARFGEENPLQMGPVALCTPELEAEHKACAQDAWFGGKLWKKTSKWVWKGVKYFVKKEIGGFRAMGGWIRNHISPPRCPPGELWIHGGCYGGPPWNFWEREV
jgi:RHS repeat-associated protein